MDFDSLKDDSQTDPQGPAQTQQSQQVKTSPSFDDLQDDSEKYGSTGQQALGYAEKFGQGLAGPVIPAIEVASGLTTPEAMRGRESQLNPIGKGLAEAGGFGTGLLTGTGEAALVGKAGEAVAGAAGLGEATGIGSRLAAGATKAATELGLMQAGDETTKVITQDPDQTIGSAAANVGLSTLLGGATGGLFTGLGAATKTGLDALGLKEFSDRLAFRGANVNPNEILQNEAEKAYNAYQDMGSEVSGANGLKAQAIQKLLPESMTSEISKQVQDISDKAADAIQKMSKDEVPQRYINKLSGNLAKFQEIVTNPEASVSDHFDALNDFKNTLQGYSKGNFGAFAVPSYHEAYDFLNATKGLGYEIRTGLENSKVWGGAADLQKNLNSAWSAAIPAVKDYEKKFMTKVGNDLVHDPAKFQSYVNQSGKATTQTIKQQMMGKFADGIEKFSNATDDVYEKAGIQNPRGDSAIPMGAIKESLNKPSIGARLADMWYDKLGAQSLGAGAGALAGNAVLPGLGGAFIGKEVLGPVFGAIIQPLMEKTANMSGYQQAMKFGKTVLAGNNQLVNSATKLFEGGSKIIPENVFSDNKKISDLDEKLADLGQNPQKMLNVAGDLGHYAPDHAQALAKTTMNAVNYLNAQRPKPFQASPLDTKIEPSKSDQMKFERTLSIAQNPLMALHHIKNSSLLPQDVQTIHALYPNYYTKMSQELTNAMTDHLSKDGDIPYSTRQSLSLFLGQPLDSTMTFQSIQSVQAIYANKSQPTQNPPVTKNKRNTSKIGKLADNLQTPLQKSEARQTEE